MQEVLSQNTNTNTCDVQACNFGTGETESEGWEIQVILDYSERGQRERKGKREKEKGGRKEKERRREMRRERTLQCKKRWMTLTSLTIYTAASFSQRSFPRSYTAVVSVGASQVFIFNQRSKHPSKPLDLHTWTEEITHQSHWLIYSFHTDFSIKLLKKKTNCLKSHHAIGQSTLRPWAGLRCRVSREPWELTCPFMYFFLIVFNFS